MKKRLFNILAIAGFLAIGGSVVSCGGEEVDPPKTDPDKPPVDPDKPVDPASKEYLFEAEYTNLEGKVGGGVSGGAEGTDMIISFANASNGYAVSFLHKENISVDYVINSNKAAKATMTISLGNELERMELKKGVYDIEVNGKKLDYNKISLKPGNTEGTKFEWFTVSPKIDLVEGENTIRFITGVNDYCNNGSGGPTFDCLKLETEAELTWTPMEDNFL